MEFCAFTLAPLDRVDLDPTTDERGWLLSLAGQEVQPQPPPLYPTLIKEPAGLILWRSIVSGSYLARRS